MRSTQSPRVGFRCAVVAHAPAGRAEVADLRHFHLRIELPAQRARLGIERHDHVAAGAGVQQIADLYRCRLERTAAAGAVVPDLLQFADVVRRQLIDPYIASPGSGIAVVAPFRRRRIRRSRILRDGVLCAVLYIGRLRWPPFVRGHRRTRAQGRDRHHDNADCREHRDTCATAQQRRRLGRRIQGATHPRRQKPRADHDECKQPRRERPQVGADFVEAPQRCRDEQQAVEERATAVATPQQDARCEHCNACDHVVEGAAEGDKPHAADSERQADQYEDDCKYARRTPPANLGVHASPRNP